MAPQLVDDPMTGRIDEIMTEAAAGGHQKMPCDSVMRE
jgi:hypothetical protein